MRLKTTRELEKLEAAKLWAVKLWAVAMLAGCAFLFCYVIGQICQGWSN